MGRRTKAVFVIVDGLGDLPVPELGGKTPLEAAATPHLDALALSGEYGLADPIVPGEVPNTDSGTAVLMGLRDGDGAKIRRGPVEAAGAGRPLKPGEIAVRVNFATLRQSADGLIVQDRRAGRIDRDTGALAESLTDLDLEDGVRASLIPTDQHRAVLVLSGSGLDPEISDTDPGDDMIPASLLRCRALRPEAQRTADKINRYVREAHRVLSRHPVNAARKAAGKAVANGVITRGAGAWFELRSLLADQGIRAAMVAGCNTVRGLALLFGYETVDDGRFTADVDTDIGAKVEAVVRALADHDLVFLHFKAPDICAHDRKAVEKRELIERLDRELDALFREDILFALAADHTTDSNTGFHTADPVPVLLGKLPLSVGRDGFSFGETACRTGTMKRGTSTEFLSRTLELMGC